MIVGAYKAAGPGFVTAAVSATMLFSFFIFKSCCFDSCSACTKPHLLRMNLKA